MYFQRKFLSVLAGVDHDFTKFMWDNLLVQTELTLNLLLQSTLNPRISAWGYFNVIFDYAANPLDTIGCKIIIHTTSNNSKSWDQQGRKGFIVGPALHQYRCIQAIDRKTNRCLSQTQKNFSMSTRINRWSHRKEE